MTVPKKFIWGCRAIARQIGATERQTFHMLESGQIPAKKIGGKWVAEEGQLHDTLLTESDGEAA